MAKDRGIARSALLRELVSDQLERLGAERPNLPELANRDEVLRLLSKEAREGSVTAAKLLLQHFHEADPAESADTPEDAEPTEEPEPVSTFDELAARRKSGE